MLDSQAKALATIIKDDDLQDYVGEGFFELIQAVVMKDPFSGFGAAKNIKELIFHMPTVIFWDKMKQFLFGTFHSYSDQLKMAEKFDKGKNDEAYIAFVKRQIHLINALDDDMKVDYFAALTRCFLTVDFDQALYFKLCKFLLICTPEELSFLKECQYDFSSQNTAMISSLFQYGLFTQGTDANTGGSCYVLSDFAKALKQDCLNYEDGLQGQTRLVSYEQLSALNLHEVASEAEINDMLNDVFGRA